MLKPQAGVNGQAEDAASLVFDPSQLLHNDCSAVMPEGLVFSVPSELPSAPFSLEIGGRLGAALFQQISIHFDGSCLLYTSPSPRDLSTSRMPSSA